MRNGTAESLASLKPTRWREGLLRMVNTSNTQQPVKEKRSIGRRVVYERKRVEVVLSGMIRSFASLLDLSSGRVSFRVPYRSYARKQSQVNGSEIGHRDARREAGPHTLTGKVLAYMEAEKV